MMHKVRATAEFNELSYRVDKLEKALPNLDISAEERECLERQLKGMKLYHAALNERIQLWKRKSEEAVTTFEMSVGCWGFRVGNYTCYWHPDREGFSPMSLEEAKSIGAEYARRLLTTST